MLYLSADLTMMILEHHACWDVEGRTAMTAARALQPNRCRRAITPSPHGDRASIADINAQPAAAALSCLNVVAITLVVLDQLDR